jgi:hypothetical protein
MPTLTVTLLVGRDGRPIVEPRVITITAPLAFQVSETIAPGLSYTFLAQNIGVAVMSAFVLTVTEAMHLMFNNQQDGNGVPLKTGGVFALLGTQTGPQPPITVVNDAAVAGLLRGVVLGVGNP